MLDTHNYYGNNLEESEFGQIHAMHINMNAVNKTRLDFFLDSNKRSLKNCKECGEVIPEARRNVIKGCQLCVECKTEAEK